MSLNCLLVEDNPIALKVLESLMVNAKIQYQSTMDGESALQIATSHPFDFIITDIGLPGISGTLFANQYRKWEKKQSKPSILTIALTAHAQDVKKKASNSVLLKCFQNPFQNPFLWKF